MTSIRKRTWKTSKGEKRQGWAVDFLDAQGARQRRQFNTRKEAEDFRVSTEGQVRAGTFRPDATRTTLEEASQAYLEHCERRMQRKERMTRANYIWYAGVIPKLHLSRSVAPCRNGQVPQAGAVRTWHRAPEARAADGAGGQRLP